MKKKYLIHPGSQCKVCGGCGWWGSNMRCLDCDGTGRKHVNGKPFYCAAEVAYQLSVKGDLEHPLQLFAADEAREIEHRFFHFPTRNKAEEAAKQRVEPIDWHDNAPPDFEEPAGPGFHTGGVARIDEPVVKHPGFPGGLNQP